MLLKRGVALFVAISVVGLVAVFFYSSTPVSLADVIEKVEIPYLLLCVFGVPVADCMVAGLRMRLFSGVVAPEISYAACVKNSAVGGFMAAATPSQIGGGVAQTYVFVKEGASVGQAISILFMTFLSSVIFYFLVSIGLFVLARGNAIPGVETSGPFLIAIVLFGSLSISGVIALVNPSAAQSLLRRITEWGKRHRLPTRFSEKLQKVFADCGGELRTIRKKHKLRILASVGLTVVIFGNKFFAGYFAARALGLDPPLAELIIYQAIINIVIYFFPTPGGSGGAEMSAAFFMSRLVPEPILGPFTVVWRMATMYLTVLAGGLILIRYLGRATPTQQESGAATVEPSEGFRL